MSMVVLVEHMILIDSSIIYFLILTKHLLILSSYLSTKKEYQIE